MKKLFTLVLSLSLMLTFFAAWSNGRAPAFAEDPSRVVYVCGLNRGA